ncbi:hypothetical protein JMUB5695_03197 [Mycobacterium heckeshornense]|uniref:hypothetical protein n=1 Tax=Mycobacterium heckeshornense TaxID=110505 RepID=UPI0019411A0F|nr:hypothetical protein [Mycobacterium heckeshornense]BCQ09747.1 hypothetical protein JMUB5695_03197 [Mycobacterium heckeshornense]
MAGGAAKNRWKNAVRYSFGGALCLLAGINVLIGSAWYLALGVAVTGGIIIVGQRRIFRAAVSRSGDEIICRYIPWCEGNAYSTLVLIPLMGVASIAAGYAPGNPAWLRVTGIIILGVTPLTVYGIVRMWLRCLLRITPSALVVRLAERGSELTEIRRELVESIEPKRTPQPVSGTWLQVAITYRAIDVGSDTTKTVVLGLRLTVQPINLLNALVVWKDGANDNPSELLDRVEQVLRGHSMAGV